MKKGSRNGAGGQRKDFQTLPRDFQQMEFLNERQKLAWLKLEQHDLLFLLGPSGVGKAQPLDAKIYTPTGFTTMGDIQIGDTILTPDGGYASIIATHPQGEKNIYRITFTNGDFVECCEDHLWKININFQSTNKTSKIVDTNYIIANHRDKHNRRCLSIGTPIEVSFQPKETLIDPYTMGILLGDGCFKGGNVDFTTIDLEIVEKINKSLKPGYVLKQNKLAFRIVKNKRNNATNIYKEEIKKYELWGKSSYEKFIPIDYLYNSTKNRFALLQGLMDSDGYIPKRGTNAIFSTTSIQLAKDFKSLVESLGGIVSIRTKEETYYSYKGERRKGRICYNCGVAIEDANSIFSMSRKKDRARKRSKYHVKRIIDKVELVGKKEAKCITISSDDGLYLTDNFTVTHNSHIAMAFAINEVIQAKYRKKIILTRPIVEAGESLGFLPGTYGEKVTPYFTPLYDCLDKMCGSDGMQREAINRCVEVRPLAYMRGVTFDNSICIFDEAQNATKMQLKLFLTRFGVNSKIIITGDPSQSDLRSSDVALMDVVARLEDIPGVGVVKFDSSSIVRHPLIAAILDRLD
jgi:phosphate starvation-inducible protein PhoH